MQTARAVIIPQAAMEQAIHTAGTAGIIAAVVTAAASSITASCGSSSWR